MKKILIILSLVLISCIDVYAEKRTGYVIGTSIYLNGEEAKILNDNDYYTSIDIKANDTIELYSPKSIKGAYIIYSVNAKTGNISYSGTWQMIGENGFLHEYIELDGITKKFDLTYKDDVTIKEIFVFNTDAPEWVEKWQKSYDDADVLLFSAHSDDEHLFFAGLIPKMIDDGKKIQVAYFTIHDEKPYRFDESLNGLWAAGVRNYPVYGIVHDKYAWTLNEAISNLKKTGLSIEDAIKYEVDLIRRFKPEIVVSHDEKGEYGHGQHMLTTYILEQSVKYLNDSRYNSDYEPFEPYKIYIHLYEENPIVMDYDIPLSYYGGKTAFQVSMNAFSKHVTQQHIDAAKWQYLNNAKEIKQYSPLYYGLYYSRVGYENEDNNMFYNVPEPVIEDKEEVPKDNIEKPLVKEESDDSIINLFRTILIILTVLLIIANLLAIIIKQREKKKEN